MDIVTDFKLPKNYELLNFAHAGEGYYIVLAKRNSDGECVTWEYNYVSECYHGHYHSDEMAAGLEYHARVIARTLEINGKETRDEDVTNPNQLWDILYNLNEDDQDSIEGVRLFNYDHFRILTEAYLQDRLHNNDVRYYSSDRGGSYYDIPGRIIYFRKHTEWIESE